MSQLCDLLNIYRLEVYNAAKLSCVTDVGPFTLLYYGASSSVRQGPPAASVLTQQKQQLVGGGLGYPETIQLKPLDKSQLRAE